MRELIVVTTYFTEEHQIKELEKCIDSVQGIGRDIALISHSHVPIHIQKKCQYYFYDHLNETSDDLNLIGFTSYNFVNGSKIISKFFNKYFYGFAIYRMFSISSQIAKMFGYDVIHHLEYDCQILSKSVIDKHSNLLETHDCVFYTDTGDSGGFLFGSYKSFRVDKLPKLFSDYDRENIKNEMLKLEQAHLENMSRNLFLREMNCCILHLNELTPDVFEREKMFKSRNNYYTLYYDPRTNTLNLFFDFRDDDHELCVTINKTESFTFNFPKGYWWIKNLGDYDRVNHVRIDNGEKIVYKKDFDESFKKIFKNLSYMLDEKNS